MHQFLDTLYRNDYTVYGIQSPIQHPADRNNSLQILEFCIALFMEETKLTVRKTDRRTIMTKGMIKDALLELLQNTPYEKITVTALCKQSEITRATFYLHYNNIDNVLDELLDDALRLTELDAIQPLPSAISNRSIENEKNIEERNPDPDALLPACQRAASNPKYRILFLDESLSHHMLRKLYQMQKPQRIPEIMRDYHLNEWEAEKIFLYMLHGNFAVNKSLGWDKNEDWYHIQKVIKRLLNP